jgi:DNA-binding transcriptional LysR family regulator
MLDVRRLRLLCEVDRRGSIAAAAQALAFTPSAVSQQLAKLEREVGVQLLDRGPRSVALTEAGRALVARADEILARVAEAEGELRTLAHASGSATLRLGSFPTAAATIALPAVALLRRDRPQVEVTVTESDPLISLGRLKAGELDAALLFEYDFVPLPGDDAVEFEEVYEEPLLVVLPKGHAAARRRSVALVELADEAWIHSTPRSSCHPFTRRACRAAGFEPRIAFHFDDYQAMQTLVAGGAGVALAPEMALATPHPGVEARPIAFRGPRRRIYSAHLPATATPLVRELVAALREAASRGGTRVSARVYG